MARKQLANMTDEELVDHNNELSNRRAQAEAEIREEQLEVNAEISRRQLRRRLENLSTEERAELAAMIKEESDNG